MELTQERIDYLDKLVMGSKLDNLELDMKLAIINNQLRELEEQPAIEIYIPRMR